MRDLFDDTRGLAMLEGAILAPILIAVLIGMVYLQRTYSAALDGGDTARRCAWTYAHAGCKGEKPEECRFDVPESDGDSGMGEFLLGASDVAGQDVDHIDSAAGGSLDGVLNALDGLSELALALMGMREEARMEADYEVERPALFGGETVRHRSSYAIMCNEVDWTVWSFFETAVGNVL